MSPGLSQTTLCGMPLHRFPMQMHDDVSSKKVAAAFAAEAEARRRALAMADDMELLKPRTKVEAVAKSVAEARARAEANALQRRMHHRPHSPGGSILSERHGGGHHGHYTSDGSHSPSASTPPGSRGQWAGGGGSSRAHDHHDERWGDAMREEEGLAGSVDGERSVDGQAHPGGDGDAQGATDPLGMRLDPSVPVHTMYLRMTCGELRALAVARAEKRRAERERREQVAALRARLEKADKSKRRLPARLAAWVGGKIFRPANASEESSLEPEDEEEIRRNKAATAIQKRVRGARTRQLFAVIKARALLVAGLATSTSATAIAAAEGGPAGAGPHAAALESVPRSLLTVVGSASSTAAGDRKRSNADAVFNAVFSSAAAAGHIALQSATRGTSGPAGSTATTRASELLMRIYEEQGEEAALLAAAREALQWSSYLVPEKALSQEANAIFSGFANKLIEQQQQIEEEEEEDLIQAQLGSADPLVPRRHGGHAGSSSSASQLEVLARRVAAEVSSEVLSTGAIATVSPEQQKRRRRRRRGVGGGVTGAFGEDGTGEAGEVEEEEDDDTRRRRLRQEQDTLDREAREQFPVPSGQSVFLPVLFD